MRPGDPCRDRIRQARIAEKTGRTRRAFSHIHSGSATRIPDPGTDRKKGDILVFLAPTELFPCVIRNQNVPFFPSICICMLMGLIRAPLCLFVAEIVPGAFSGLPNAPWLGNFATAVYFSFVTITTPGYGDKLPALPLARFLFLWKRLPGSFKWRSWLLV